MDRVDRLRGAPADVSFPARAEYGEEYVILIDNGDTFQGTPVSEVHLLRGNHPEGEPEAMALEYYDDRITTYRLSPDVFCLFNFYEVTGEAGE